MIVSFIGQRGSGKTLTMVKEAYIKYRQGYKIFSNIHLNFEYTPYNIDDLMQYAEDGKYFGNTVFIIDELHIYFDSRSSARKRNRIFSYFLNQSSKNDMDIYYTTQFISQVEVRLRRNTEMVVENTAKCLVWHAKDSKPIIKYNYRPKGSDYRVDTYIRNIIVKFNDVVGDNRKIRYYYGNPYFKLYDTREVVKMQSTRYEDKDNKISTKDMLKYRKLNKAAHKDFMGAIC